MTERFFKRDTDIRLASEFDNFGRIVIAEGRSDFHRLIVEESVRSYQNSGVMFYPNKSSKRMSEGKLFKIPSGVPDYEDQIELASEISNNEIVAIHGHGDLTKSQIMTLVNSSSGNRDITLDSGDYENEDLRRTIITHLTQSVSKDVVNSEISGYGTASVEKMVRMIYQMGHTQCGAAQSNFGNVLGNLIENANNALYDPRPEAQKSMHFIDLRGDVTIGAVRTETNNGLRLQLKAFTKIELDTYLQQRGLKIGFETQCVDDNFPFDTAKDSGLAEKAYLMNNKINRFLAERERTREDSYLHNVAMIFVGTPEDSKYAAFLQTSFQVGRNMSARSGEYNMQLANASAALIYLAKPEMLLKYLKGISGIYELVGPGHMSRKMKKHSGFKFEANPLYHQRYPQMRGVSIGVGNSLTKATLIRTASKRFEDIPRGPALVFSQSSIVGLGGWERTLNTLDTNFYYYSTVMEVNTNNGDFPIIQNIYDNTSEDNKPISNFGWRNQSN